MVKMVVNNKAGLGFPGAAPSAFGEEVDVTEDLAKNPAVEGWIKAGLLVKPKDFARPSSPAADLAVKAALDQAQADLAARDVTVADQARQIADLEATVAKLTADLEAASAPADKT